MQKKISLVLDTFCEVYDLLEPWADAEFWNFEEHVNDGKLITGAVYLIGRRQMQLWSTIIQELVKNNIIKVIFSNPAEGSDTLRSHCDLYRVSELLKEKKMLLIGGGDMDPSWPCLQYDSFLPKVFDYDENIKASNSFEEIYVTSDKPYKFLFFNGRMRSHRKYLLEQFRVSGLLDKCLWTCLDATHAYNSAIQLQHDNVNLMNTIRPIKNLPYKYEIDRYRDRIDLPKPTDTTLSEWHLWNNEWGAIYINPNAYIDTYFSLITETVFTYPYSFRTEKIWKPVAMGHPWIAVANQGFYRDMHNLGFQTFGHVIDESFDKIENNQERIERIAAVVEDLCQQDLANFLKECYNVCKYNQQHLAEMRIKVRKEFPTRFFNFLEQYRFDE